MAAGEVNKLNLELVHGTTKKRFTLTRPEDEPNDSPLTVGHLSAELERITGVPVTGQKLIVKGKSLKDPTASLTSQGVRNGSKVMLIGKKPNIEEDENMKKMKKVEDQIEKTQTKLSEINSEVEGIEKGYLQSDLKVSALSKLTTRVGGHTEECTRLLESLDSLILGDAAPEIRGKRKSLAIKLNAVLDQCDGLLKRIQNLQEKC